MRALNSLSARFAIPGSCLIAALAAGCSFDASQLRALPDGAGDHPAVHDAGAAGSGGDTASPFDAPTGGGGNGGLTGTGGNSGVGGIGDGGDAGVLDSPGAQPDVPIGGSGGGTGGTGGGTIISTGGTSGTGGATTAGGAGEVDGRMGASDAGVAGAGDAGTTPSGWIDRTPSPLPASWPTVRSEHAMAYDVSRNKVVMYGGWLGSANYRLDETWEWDGTAGTWTNRTPSPLPSSWPLEMVGPAIGYSGHGGIFLFGGFASGLAQLNDAWAWDGSMGTWTNLTPLSIPTAWPASRAWYAMAYDTGRDRIVIFGGTVSDSDQGTWEWNPTAGIWTNRTPSPLPSSWPPNLGGNAMAYDAGRGKIVMFGGNGSAQNLFQHIWEWDGTVGTWTNRTPSPLPSSWPSARTEGAMAYDSRRGKSVYFGGNIGRSGGVLVTLADTWEWDGTAGTWTNCTPSPLPASWPEARSTLAMAYDGDKVMLFGGGDYVTLRYPTSQTWEWAGCPSGTTSGGGGDASVPDGGGGGDAADVAVADSQVDTESALKLQWLNRTPTTLPPSWPTPRFSPGIAYDLTAMHSVLFAGGGGPGEGGGLRSDTTWSWDGANGNWIGRTPSPYPTDWPVPRWMHAITYDGSRQRTVVFGGWDGSNARNDLWEWNDTAGMWLDRTPAQLPASWPPGLVSIGVAFDSGRNKVVLFGGRDGCDPVYSLWEWDGTARTWTNRTPSPLPLAWPSARHSPALAYDSARGVVVLFGGATSACAGTFLNDLWEWEGKSGTWTNRTPSPLPANWPSARSGASLAFHSAQSVMVLFGGSDVPCQAGGCVPTTGYRSDTWLWDGKAGTLTLPTVVGAAPPARAFHGATYDSDRSCMVIFGGIVAGGISVNDTWDLRIQ